MAVAVNAGNREEEVTIPWPFDKARDLETGRPVWPRNGMLYLSVPPMGSRVVCYTE